MNYIGFDIGGTKCAVILGNEKGEILSKERFDTTDCHTTVEKLISAAKALGGNPVAAGISCGGPLDEKRGIIMSPPNLPGWDNIEITKIISDSLGIPTLLRNDANACALAEWKFGAGVGCENMIFLTFGTGLGAGLILDGKLYGGTNGNAGEVGHIRMNPFGPVGYGKSGSLEGFASGSGIAQLGKTAAMEKLQQGGSTGYCASFDELDTVTAKSIAQSARQGDETAIEVYRTCGTMFGRGLAVLTDILNPQKIVIGSIYPRCIDLLRESIDVELKKECLPMCYECVEVVPALLDEQIGDIAALSVAMENII